MVPANIQSAINSAESVNGPGMMPRGKAKRHGALPGRNRVNGHQFEPLALRFGRRGRDNFGMVHAISPSGC